MSINQVVDAYLASPRGQAVMQAMTPAFIEIVRQQTEAEFGERCEDFEPECVVCKAWAQFDQLTGGGEDGAAAGIKITDIEHEDDTYYLKVDGLFDVRLRRITGGLEVAVFPVEGIGEPLAECVAWDEDAKDG